MPSYKWRTTQTILKKEYIQGIVDITDEGDRVRYYPTTDELSEKHGVPIDTVRDWSYTEGWAGLRQQHIDRQNSELIEDTDWYSQERVRTDSLTIATIKKLMKVLRQEMDDFEEQRVIVEGRSITQLEKNGRILGGWARAIKDLKVAAELSLTNKDGSPKTMGEGVGRSTDEVKQELDELLKRHNSMR